MTARFATIAAAEAFIAQHDKGTVLVTHTSWTDGARRKGPVLVGLRYARNRFATEDLTIEQAIAAQRTDVAEPVVAEGRPVRSERHVYTPSGKKRTNKQVCLGLYRSIKDRDAFIKAAVAKGVKAITARTLFNDIAAGRVG